MNAAGKRANAGDRQQPQRIAHAYGNTRDELKAALATGIDIIELDAWLRAGQVWVRHEPRQEPLPLLIDRRMRGHPLPPYTLPLWRRWYVRFDVDRLTLDEVLNTVAGRKGLLMDVKGVYHGRWNLEFARTLARKIDEHKAAGWTQVCGQFWPVLDSLRTEAPGLEVRYSIERPLQWEKFARLLDEDESVRPICIERRLLNEERSLFLDERGVSVYCWTVDNHDEAEQLVHAGVDGIISNDLGLLAHLGTAVRDEVNGAGLEGGDDARASLDR